MYFRTIVIFAPSFAKLVHYSLKRSAAYGLDIEVVARAVQGDKRVVVESAEHTAADGVGYGNAVFHGGLYLSRKRKAFQIIRKVDKDVHFVVAPHDGEKFFDIGRLAVFVHAEHALIAGDVVVVGVVYGVQIQPVVRRIAGHGMAVYLP